MTWRERTTAVLLIIALPSCTQVKSQQVALTGCPGTAQTSTSFSTCDRSIDDIIITSSIPPSDKSETPPRVGDDGTQRVSFAADAYRSERKEVLTQMATVSPDVTASIAPPVAGMIEAPRSAERPGPRAVKPVGKGKMLSLADAVAVAVLSHPQMGAQAAKITATKADIDFAEGQFMPKLEVSAGVGHAVLGSYQNDPTPFNSGSAPGLGRGDVGLTFRQLIYDFGAARAEVQRNKAVEESERLKLADTAEDIALRTVNAYLNILEQVELIALIDRTVADQRKLADLVLMSQQNGNGTKADVDRIKAKVIEIEAMRTDIVTAHQNAVDEFHRLTDLEPQQVRRPKSIAGQVPKTLVDAVRIARADNPALLSLKTTSVALDHQLDGQKASSLPRVDLQGDGLLKNYFGVGSSSQSVVDTRLMVMVSYKLFDGGLAKAQEDRIVANQQANKFKVLDQDETIELNLRRFYQSLASNRAKRSAALAGVSTAENANRLYIEQFKAGKRTIFEVLDSNFMLFTMKKNSINGEFEELRASYGILRNMGHLVDLIARG